jgi:thiol-disulfide isomerase/thioredoxin
MRRGVVAVAAASALLLTACSSDAPEVGAPVDSPTTTRPLGPLGIDVASDELVALKAEAGMLDCPPSPEPDANPSETTEPTETPGTALPAITLPCLGGGRDVRLSQLDGPLLINLWASNCAPCRDELPVLQQVHELADEQVTVLGIDYKDAKPLSALELAAESGVTFASLADLDGVTATELQVVALPQTVLVDEFGTIVTMHRRPITSYDEAGALLGEHLGVTLRQPEPTDEPQ